MTAFRVDETKRAMDDALIAAGYHLEALVASGDLDNEMAGLLVRKVDRRRAEWLRAVDDFAEEWVQ